MGAHVPARLAHKGPDLVLGSLYSESTDKSRDDFARMLAYRKGEVPDVHLISDSAMFPA